MECPKCGFVMDAFSSECPRCKRLGVSGGGAPTPGNVRQATVAGPMNRTSMTNAQASYARGSTGDTAEYISVVKLVLALVGATLLIIGVLLPIISFISSPGKINLLQLSSFLKNGNQQLAASSGNDSMAQALSNPGFIILFFKYAAYIFVVISLLAIVSAISRWYAGLRLSSIAALVFSVFTIGFYVVKVLLITSTMNDSAVKAGSSALAELAKMPSLFAIYPLGWGAIILLIGGVIMLTSSILEDPSFI